MALIKCPECGREISDKSHHCIYCGYPLEEMTKENEVTSSKNDGGHPVEEMAKENEVTSSKNEGRYYKAVLTACPQDKIAIAIKIVREVTGLGLRAAKIVVDDIPSVVRYRLLLEEAQEIQSVFDQEGITISILDDADSVSKTKEANIQKTTKNSNQQRSKGSGIVFLAVILVIIFIIGKACGIGGHEAGDGKCDICGKRATKSIGTEEYCSEHYGDAEEWYIEEAADKFEEEIDK